MTEFYLDFETLGVRPDYDKIITIQYQQVDTRTGVPKGSLTVLKEWESSEKEILKEFLEVINPENVWDFIPIGYNLRFELHFLQARLRKVLKYELSNEWLNYNLPRVDIGDLLIIINEGQVKGATLDWFIDRESDNSEIPNWYEGKEYAKIEAYIEDETKRFLHAYQFLKKEIPLLYKDYKPLE
ncbi:MAG: ribonuclease H-like domain-containing protein [Candidatus Thorarchaeota archaeon]|jgi:DNA polymerase III epsilon subunit-like protein